MSAVMANGLGAMQSAVPQSLQQQQQLLLAPAAMQTDDLRLSAYQKVFAIFMQGAYDLAKEDALASLRSALSISDKEHESAKAAAMADAQHHLQLHPLPSQTGAAGAAGAVQETSAAHSSQPAGPAGANGASKRATPGSGNKAAASRKRTRVSDGGAAAAAAAAIPAATGAPARGSSRAAAKAQAGGPAGPAPRAAPGVEVDPLVGHVVMRHWPNDGGWFRGVISDYRTDTGHHCIIYEMGSASESFEWYRIRGASEKDCLVQEEKVDFASLSLPAATGGAASQSQPPAAKGKKAPAGAAASAPPRGAKQQGGGSGGSKAGAPRPAIGAPKAAAGAAKPAASRAAALKAAAKSTPPAPAVPQQAAQPAAAPAPQQQPAKNGKTHSHHNGLTSHAAALKQALAAGARPPYLNGHALLPRRTRNWSSDEESSDDDDE